MKWLARGGDDPRGPVWIEQVSTELVPPRERNDPKTLVVIRDLIDEAKLELVGTAQVKLP